MRRTVVAACLVFPLLGLVGCSKMGQEEEEELPVQQVEPLKNLVVPMLPETSGIADSKTVPGHLWAHQDSGNPAHLYLVSHFGAVLKEIPLKGVQNRDWEDMALADGRLYIADIGDNSRSAPEYRIYHFPEPTLATDTVRNVSVIRFRYPDGSHDAEAFLLDPVTKNILLLTKHDSVCYVYRLTYPYATGSTVQVAQKVGSLPYPYVVSAAMTLDGRGAVVKTYAALHLHRAIGNESLETFLFQKSTTLPYNTEPQGEAFTFAAADSGYFTLSEKGLASAVYLYFYPKK